MVEDVSLIRHVGPTLESFLHCLDALLVLLEGEVSDTLLVKNLRVSIVVLQRLFQVVDGGLIHLHIEVALGTVAKEFNVVRLSLNSLVKMVYSFIEVAQGVVAATKSIVDGWILVVPFALLEVFNSFTDEA